MAVSLADVPLRPLHDLVIRSRLLYFTVDVPNATGFVLDEGVDTLEPMLAAERWEDGRIPSFYYHGEDLNLRRPAGKYTLSDGRGPYWFQDHARFFELVDGRTWALCHNEPAPATNPGAHYDEIGFSWERGRQNFSEQLVGVGVDHYPAHLDDVEIAGE